ncbi:N-ethylammeline chlorohydrolase [candidate division MSBL1 archaeon SCGC-AAA259J03]|uniref:5-methylthioadenosine/S-adenosylhomocysteine deaminase n=1 Tax=candidate division MSBL1 archaeon SCGC-AAA259J03 TaxID=1698269 RepID=A0A656YWH9_9EURY|nr:N-ethylammeline chlorohydrolase [candidate division MSBL1 archaeon SCGC-AAA259J03]
MTDILIKNGYILTMNEDREIIKKGDIAIEGDQITDIGEDLEKNNSEKAIDARNKAVLPGLINAHTHLSMVLFRGVADDLDLQTWLEEKIWPLEANLESEDVYIGALLGCLEMIKSGTTCFADLYFFMDRVAEAVEKSGLRANLAYGIIEQNDPEKRKKELEVGKKLVKDLEGAADGRISTMFGPHSTYTCSVDCLKEVRELADKHDVGIHIHLSENEREVEDVVDMYDKRPPELLDSIDFLASDVLAAHCTCLNEHEIDLLQRNNVKPVHNPVSNMKLGSGIAPVPELLSRNVPVSLGTDGAASNNSLDMFDELKFAALLSKIGKKDPTVVPARKALETATIHGAEAIGRENEIGSLEPGKKADIILVDMKKPHLTPIFNIESHLVYSCNGSDVDSVIVNGEILMNNREILTLDEEKILKDGQKTAEKLAEKV